MNREKTLRYGKLIVVNALHFAFNLAFIMVFQLLFGMENVLVGVAIGVGLTMLPVGYVGIRPWTMAGIIVLLYTGGVIAGQSALLPLWLALPVNFLFVLLIMVLTCEPTEYKPSISFLLCFVFSQSTPVHPAIFPSRLLGTFIASLAVALITVYNWKKEGYGADGRNLKEQTAFCVSRRGYILRMSTGIAIAMFVGMILGLKKPLWISIVVMSLTQLHFHETLERIRHRLFGNIVGILFFIVVFRLLIPEKYAFAMVLFLGYISFFTSEYKYKQIVNAVSAINASLVLLDTSTAISNRLLCLAGGAAIVLALYEVQKYGRWIVNRLQARHTIKSGV